MSDAIEPIKLKRKYTKKAPPPEPSEPPAVQSDPPSKPKKKRVLSQAHLDNLAKGRELRLAKLKSVSDKK
jgi:hypothetical protein